MPPDKNSKKHRQGERIKIGLEQKDNIDNRDMTI